jgi:DNA polymerase-3 subunit delta
MKPLELQKAIKQKKIAPLYFLYGEESFLLEETITSLKESLVDPNLLHFNYTVFNGRESTAQDIVTSAKTHPLSGGYRMVVVKEADKLKSSGKDFTTYFNHPSLTTCLVFCGEKLSLKSNPLSAFKKKGVLVRFYHPYDREMPGWIKTIAQFFNKKVSGSAVALLSTELENDLQTLYKEVEKIAAYVGTREVIEVDDVKEVVSVNRGTTVFTLTDRIADRDKEGALSTLKQLLAAGEPPLKILTMITRQVRMLAQANEMLGRGLSKTEVGKNLGIRDFYLKDFIRRARVFSRTQGERSIHSLFHTDWKLKSSRVDKKIVLEDLISGLCVQ